LFVIPGDDAGICFVVQQWMRGSGSGTFPDPNDYRAQLPGTKELLVLEPQQFGARLTWADLPRVHLLRAQETAPRVRYVALPPDHAFVAFPMHRDTVLLCSGIEVRAGDIVFHAHRERFHERTAAPARWAILSMRVETLSLFARTLTGSDLEPPAAGCVIRPRAVHRQKLARLLTQAARLVETKPDVIGHREVSRALEEELIYALMTCLTADVLEHIAPVMLHEPLMVSFEEMLAQQADRVPGVAEITDAIGASEPSLQACCLKVLGMSAVRYLYLRRLALVHALLLHTGSYTSHPSDLPRQHGFADFHHFVTEYQRAFGSTPPLFQ
jgi:AraC-like DNA-binding protein